MTTVANRWPYNGRARSPAWTGSWTGAPDNPSVVSAVSAMIRVIYAASAHGARGRAPLNPLVQGSSPWNPTCPTCDMAITPYGHIEQLPSGSFRVKVYAGKSSASKRTARIGSVSAARLMAP